MYTYTITHATGQSEEEYILLADYVTDAVGELSLTAGDVVQLINRETTGEQRNGVCNFAVCHLSKLLYKDLL